MLDESWRKRSRTATIEPATYGPLIDSMTNQAKDWRPAYPGGGSTASGKRPTAAGEGKES